MDDNEKFSKYNEIFEELSNKRISEIQNMKDQIDFDNLIYYFITPSLAPINFIRFKGPMHIYNDIKNGDTTLEKTEEDEKQFESNLIEITTGNANYRKEDQLNTIKNLKNLYKSREKVNKLFNDYTKIRSEAMYKTKQGTRLKILTPKQMLQRLPIALAQVKAGNNSENLLNQIRQIVHSLYQSKETTKKVYSNIIKSI